MLRPIWIRGSFATLALATFALAVAADVLITDDAGSPVVRYARSHALLVGVSDYTAGWKALESVPGELEELQAALESHGFTVETVLDPSDDDALRPIVDDFIDRHGYRENNRLLIFFAGHGHTRTIGGVRRGYLVPADAPLPTSGKVQAFLEKSVPMTQVLGWARQIEARHALFVFDSCFSGTILETRSEIPEPAHVTTLTGRPVRQFLTAGRAGETVPSRSVFTPALVRGLGGAADLTRDGYVTGTELYVYLHQEVAGSGQTPQYGKLSDPGFREGDFVFRLPQAGTPYHQRRDAALVRLRHHIGPLLRGVFYDEVAEALAIEPPTDVRRTLIKEIERLDASELTQRRLLAYVDDHRLELLPGPGEFRTERALSMKFRYVPGSDSFQMGSPETEPGRNGDETLHAVTLSRGFWMGETEVTQAQWRQLMGTAPSSFESCGDRCPVEQVSWYEAVAFANALSKKTGYEPCYTLSGSNGERAGEGLEYREVRLWSLDCDGYRLPTEAEWERAARADESAAIHTGGLTLRGTHDGPELDPIAWYGGNSGVSYEGGEDCSGWVEKRDSSSKTCGTHPVGLKKANRWGLHDMLGNVWEWVEDAANWDSTREEIVTETYWNGARDPLSKTGPLRVFRGCGWLSSARFCRSANRGRGSPGGRGNYVGFRLVRTLKTP